MSFVRGTDSARASAMARVFIPTTQNPMFGNIASFLASYEILKLREVSRRLDLCCAELPCLRHRVDRIENEQQLDCVVPFYLYQTYVSPGIERVVSCRRLALLAKCLKQQQTDENPEQVAKTLGISFLQISRWHDEYFALNSVRVIRMIPPKELSSQYKNTWKIVDDAKHSYSVRTAKNEGRQMTSAEKAKAFYCFLKNKTHSPLT